MRKKVNYFLIVAGALLFLLNLWSADFRTEEINFWSAGASILMVVLGFVELRKYNNEN
ncbi:hypothetical protein FIC_00134 [Flavobacteriaceae bacterium 3519-10]|nr:hypothetical protein FIC_00134 [Flavobacteriaceae bacterium 3519-10]